MAIYRHYECAACGGRFRWLHHPNDSPPPEECQLCHSPADPDLPPVFVPQAPLIHNVRHESGDRVYRQMEAASEQRAEDAASILGVPVSEVADLKITNMRDNQREGDIAAITPPNPVRQFMDQNRIGGNRPMQVGNQAVTPQDFAQATTRGPYPFAGENTRQKVSEIHRQIAGEVQRAGQIAKHG